MMHASTSPLYPIIVSNDITAAMMEGPGGLTLTNESILEAVAFRQTIGRVHRQFTERGEWFFRTWNADTVKDPKTGKTVRFEDAPADRLVLDPDCWELHPGEVWHRNAPLAEVMPSLANGYPGTYTSLGLRALADQMFAQLNETRQMHWLAEAFSTLPVPVMTPNAAYQHLVRDQIEHVPVDELADRVLATSIVPYPPGIPLLMPGEATGAAHGPYLSYLRALWSWDRRFPGFGHDTHGIEHRDGTHYVQCLKKDICSQIQSRRPSAS